jgi:hypothetical protein
MCGVELKPLGDLHGLNMRRSVPEPVLAAVGCSVKSQF